MELIDRAALIEELRRRGLLKMDMTKDSAEMIAVQSIIDAAPVFSPIPDGLQSILGR